METAQITGDGPFALVTRGEALLFRTTYERNAAATVIGGSSASVPTDVLWAYGEGGDTPEGGVMAE